jgi:hypothetical protein
MDDDEFLQQVLPALLGRKQTSAIQNISAARAGTAGRRTPGSSYGWHLILSTGDQGSSRQRWSS